MDWFGALIILGLVGAMLAFLGVFIALAMVAMYAFRHNYRVWKRKRDGNRFKALQSRKSTAPVSPNEPIKMKEGKDGIRWGGNVYQIKAKE